MLTDNHWTGIYSLAADQLAQAGGFELIKICTPQCVSRELRFPFDATVEEVKVKVLEALQKAGCKKLWQASIYLITHVEVPFISVICRGEFA